MHTYIGVYICIYDTLLVLLSSKVTVNSHPNFSLDVNILFTSCVPHKDAPHLWNAHRWDQKGLIPNPGLACFCVLWITPQMRVHLSFKGKWWNIDWWVAIGAFASFWSDAGPPQLSRAVKSASEQLKAADLSAMAACSQLSSDVLICFGGHDGDGPAHAQEAKAAHKPPHARDIPLLPIDSLMLGSPAEPRQCLITDLNLEAGNCKNT